MIRIRVVSPADVTGQLISVIASDPSVLNLAVVRGSVTNPDGDAVEFEVPQGKANEVVELLRSFGAEDRGSISLEEVATPASRTAARVIKERPRFDEFAPVWDLVDARIRADGQFPPSWYMLLVIAGLIGVVGILTNSQILIVGAMVVGPEYGAIVSLAFGVIRREPSRISSSIYALVVGFSLAIIGAILLSLVVRSAGLTPTAFLLGVRPVSHLINTPDWFSVMVAVLAGVVGVISLTEARASTLIGVFISVTTIPAAADIGVCLPYGLGKQALGSAEQLLLNVALLTVVAIAGIPAQRAVWRRVTGNNQRSSKKTT
ncbi:MAG TPA: DUF389 domain-containing protein [Acidimicrobiales bacterium]|nr:DUF389 domain-containing protein [Acidimicrobiales bacterium]